MRQLKITKSITNRESASLDKYLQEIGREELISVEEEVELAARIKDGDERALEKLTRANLRFVVSVAKQYQNQGLSLPDLINEGNLGLMYAAQKYNPSSNAKFSTYAAWWIREYIQKAIRDTATGIKFPSAKYKEMKNAKWKFASLDKKVKGADEEETTLLHMVKDEKSLTPEDQFISKESVCNLHSVIDKLKHTEQAVIIMRYGLNGENPMSLSEVGNVIGCSKERVRQIETKAIKLLRNCLDANIAA